MIHPPRHVTTRAVRCKSDRWHSNYSVHVSGEEGFMIHEQDVRVTVTSTLAEGEAKGLEKA